jgi:hypothetical protein
LEATVTDAPDEGRVEGPASEKAALWSYGTGLALLGAAVGYYVGSSESPVVAAALPLLFGLVSGAGGLYLAKVDLSKKINRTRLTAIGMMLSAFVVCLLIGTVIGIALRTGIGLSVFFADLWGGSQQQQSAVLDTEDLSTADALRLALLRSNLRALGASHDEQSAILKAARAGIDNGADQQQIAELLQKAAVLVNKAQELVKGGTADVGTSDEGANQEFIDAADMMSAALQKVANEIGRYDRYLKTDKPPIPAGYLAGRFHEFGKDVEPPYVDDWLATQPELSNALFELQVFLVDTETRLANTWVDGGEELREQINGFLRATAGAGKGADEEAQADYQARAIRP